MTIWIFGDSLSLPYNLKNPNDGWPTVLSKKLGADCKNFAQPAVDNFFIYQSYLTQANHIHPTDLVIIGWTHPNRKMFVLDRNNHEHMKTLEIGSNYVYQSGGREYMRGKNENTDTVQKWRSLLPRRKQNPFYDTWFEHYFSNHEHLCNLKSYHDSVSLTCPAQYLSFFFSKESIGNLELTKCEFMLEFITKTGLTISDQDCHLNSAGHQAWADLILSQIIAQKKEQLFPVIELVDRYTIAKLKFDKTQANQQELDFYTKNLGQYDLTLISDDLSQLYNTHLCIWNLESQLKSNQEHELSLEEIGRRAIQIRDWNHQRIALKNSMAEKLRCVVREIKKDHLSQ